MNILTVDSSSLQFHLKSSLVSTYNWIKDSFTGNHQITKVVAVGGATAGLVALAWREWRWHRNYKLPPGPTPLPFLGNIMSIGTGGSDFHLKVQKLRKQYGDVMTIWLGSSPTVFISSTELAREAYLQKGNDYAGRPYVWSMNYLTEGGKDMLGGQFTPVWQLQRKIAHAGMRKYATGAVFEQLLLDVFREVEMMLSAASGPVDVMHLMILLTYNIFHRITFGKKLSFNDPIIETMRKKFEELGELLKNGLLADMFPLFRFIETQDLKTLKNTFCDLKIFLFQGFEEHMNNFDPDDMKDLTDELIAEWRKAEESEDSHVLSQFTKGHFQYILADIFVDGTDTARMTLTYIIGYLCAYPDVQAKAQKELDSVLGRDGEVRLSCRKQLPYTEAVVMEVMRHLPIIPLGETHATTCDTTLGPYRLPKGTAVTLNVYGIHRDDRNFKDADEFYPDRWLGEDGQVIRQPYSFLSFSMGRRVCVGESIAKVMLHLLTAMLLHKFEFRAADGQVVPPAANFAVGGLEPGPLSVCVTRR